jgi:2-hydroxychromene-2-carboxylate isomerase
MTKTLEFHYDFSCPYAYLASTQVGALAERVGAALHYRPFLLGGIYKHLGADPMASMSPARARLNGLDMHRWAEHWQVPFSMPPGHPNRTVLALRAALSSDDLPRASHALFDAYWARGLDLSDPDVVGRALSSVGFDGPALVAAAPSQRDELFRRTAEAAARGVFGAPAFFVNGELYWGQDRMDQVERALGGTPPRPTAARRRAGASLDFFYDFSSPFAFLASRSVEGLCERTGAELRYRPFLLGALFRAIGTPDVPLHSFPDAKRRYYELDLARAAAERSVKLAFPSRFPIRTVLPLRLALASGPEIARVTRALFDAAWVHDRDIESEAVLRELCAALGLSPELVAAAGSEPVKRALRESTDEAVALGLCGAPSFVVDGQVYWGQDRLDFVERALGAP